MKHEMIKELERTINRDHKNITGIVVQKNGVKAYEDYFNGFTADDAVHVFSVTKSIVSALIGIAIDAGHIQGVKQKVMDFFPDYPIEPGEKSIQSITIEDLLTMTAPYKYETEPYETFFASENWVKAALNLLGGKEKTGEFLYCAIIGPHILSGILVQATGQSIIDFAMKKLFSPLGIKTVRNMIFHSKEDQFAWSAQDKHAREWVVDPQGINTAGWGLALTPTDMAGIGQLYLEGGMHDGRRIISESWLKESTEEHSRWKHLDLKYGYLWWIIDDDEQAYAAMGDGGNVIYVNLKKQLVVSIASLFQPNVTDRIELIRNHIEPIFKN